MSDKLSASPTWAWLVGVLLVLCVSLTGIIWTGINGRLGMNEQKIEAMTNDMAKMTTHFEYIRSELQTMRQMLERKP